MRNRCLGRRERAGGLPGQVSAVGTAQQPCQQPGFGPADLPGICRAAREPEGAAPCQWHPAVPSACPRAAVQVLDGDGEQSQANAAGQKPGPHLWGWEQIFGYAQVVDWTRLGFRWPVTGWAWSERRDPPGRRASEGAKAW
jgi:hypothetical protein